MSVVLGVKSLHTANAIVGVIVGVGVGVGVLVLVGGGVGRGVGSGIGVRVGAGVRVGIGLRLYAPATLNPLKGVFSVIGTLLPVRKVFILAKRLKTEDLIS